MQMLPAIARLFLTISLELSSVFPSSASAADLIGDIIGGVLDVLDEDNPNDETEEGGTG